jgi:hypothetical protein
MILAFEHPNGRLTDIARRERTSPSDVELDVMPVGPGPWQRDPANLRRAIAHVALTADEAREERIRRGLSAELRMAAWQRIRARFVAAGRPTAWIDARIAAADAEVVDAMQGVS